MATTTRTAKTLTAGTVLRFAGDFANNPKTVTVTSVEGDWFRYLDTDGRGRCAPAGLVNTPRWSVVS